MKQITLLLIFALIASISFGQVTIFSENFEGPVLMTSSSFSGSGPAWTLNSTYQSQGVNSYSNVVTTSDTLWLTSPNFVTTGNTFVKLDFDHICKVDFFDGAIIQVSNNNGASWTQLTGAQYLGSSSFAAQGNKFTAAAYSIWDPGNATASPDNNTWWQHEIFDLSAYLANSPTAMIRFALFDGNANGASGNYGWILDDIKVTMAPCELNPPTISMVSNLSGTVYSLGPYTVSANITDASGVDTAWVNYSVNGGPQNITGMTNVSGSLYQGTIPAVLDSDTVCYFVYARDVTIPCANDTFSPASGCTQFVASAGITFPYYDNFDSGDTLWYDSTVTVGTSWELGTPAFGATNSAYSSPNSWDVNLTIGYGANAETYLTSPILDFSSVTNATLTFWHNYNSESGWDGHRMDYSTDGGQTWQVLGTMGDPNGVNWYTSNSINSSGQPAWDGSSAGWVQSSYYLAALNGLTNIKFRFVFESDGSVQMDGASVDNFSITIPLANDVGVNDIVRPALSAAVGTQDTVEVVLENFGLTAETTFDVSYSVNGGAAVTETWVGNLAPGATTNFVFSTLMTVPYGNYTICAWTELSNDMDNQNDTLCESRYGVPYDTLSYFTDFDTGSVWIPSSPNNGTDWQLGNPTFGSTNTTYSAPNSWDINLNSGYGPNADANLETQLFDFTNANDAILSFWHNYNTESSWDGHRLEYSINGGTTWQVLGTMGDPLATNWYTSASINSSGLAAWEGNSNGWIESEYILSALNGQANVKFRFVFTSDGSVQVDGSSVDNFSIYQPYQYDLEMQPISNPTSGCSNGNSEPVTVCVYNAGYDTIFTYDVSYQLAGSPNGLVTETVSTPILPFTTACHTFATTEDLSVYGNYLFDYYVNTPLDQNTANDSILGDTVSSYSGCNAFIKIVTSFYATQLSWDVIDNSNNQVIHSIPAGTYTTSNTTYYDTIRCLAPGGSYNLVMNHSQFSSGQWELTGYDTVSYGGASFNGLTQTNFQFTAQCPPELSTEMRGVIIPGMILPLPDTYNILGRYRNDGLTKIDSVDITLEIDGSIIATEKAVPTAALDFDDQDVHTFAPQWNAMPGCHDIRIWTSNPNGGLDNYMVTDTVYREVCIIDSTSNYPYCNDFDSGLPDWATLNAYSHKSGTSWEFGTPNQTIINGAHSGNNAWMTRLDTNYYDKLDSSALYSPLFTVDTVECYKLEFWHQYDTEANADGGGIEYSLDKGATWQLLGSYQDTVNWYNSDYITGYMNQDGFSGTSNGWEQSSYTMKFFNQGKVLFRFRFATNGSSALDGEGWAVDDVCFETAGNCGIVGIGDIEIAGYDLGQNVPNPTRGNTTISYTIPEGDQVSFSIVNVLGQEMYMEEGMKQSGEHKIEIDASEWGDGVYYYMLTYKGSRKVKKLIITK